VRLRAAAALTAAVVAFAACEDDPVAPAPQVIEDITYAPALGIDLASMTQLPSGVYILDDPAGMGALLADNDSIEISHTGWLNNGAVFSSGVFRTRHNGSPPRLIEGFDIGLEGMAVGGTRLMIIPPALGYGAAPNGPIPGGSVLIFEVGLQAILP
jgi:peptidylprolyl isomerase